VTPSIVLLTTPNMASHNTTSKTINVDSPSTIPILKLVFKLPLSKYDSKGPLYTTGF
jgi:hypothetical protein